MLCINDNFYAELYTLGTEIYFPPSPPSLQGALPAFDQQEGVERSLASVQGSGYHNGGVRSNLHEKINTDDIINSIGYGPLQVCPGVCEIHVNYMEMVVTLGGVSCIV